MSNRLYIFDALSGKLRVSSERFMTVGAAKSSTFRVEMKARIGGTFAVRGDNCRFFPHGLVKDYSINGLHPGRDVSIHLKTLYLVVVCDGCFVCWFGPEEEMPDFSSYDSSLWYTYDMKRKAWSPPFRLPELVKSEGEVEPDTLVAFEGMHHCAFLAKDMMSVARFAGTLERFQKSLAETQEAAEPKERLLLCPSCWEIFRAEDMLAIAAQPDLRGDDLLGESAMKRFKPTRYNKLGLPLDESGTPCRGTACPHCHSKLPPFFAELNQHIISILGASGAGKTYYLTTLINEAVKAFSRDFDASLRDIDPAANAPLNRMRQQLFSATIPQQAYIGPTRVKEPHYHYVWKNNNFHPLPTPYLYGISRHGTTCSILTYDNAGGDFDPEHMEGEELATGHLASASAIFFLFDPTASPSFRRLLQQSAESTRLTPDSRSNSRQGQLLGELEVRLRMRLNLPPPAKLPIPIAFIMCKSDVWLSLLGPEPLLPIVRNGHVMPACVQTNSARLRRLLFSVSPQLCSSAEALSDNVSYFAVSSLGKAPVEFMDPDTRERFYAPESGATRPDHVMDPLLWALSILEPNLLPKHN